MLQARGQVDRIAGRQALLGSGHDLTGRYPDSPLEPECGKGLAHLRSRSQGSQGVVFVRRRNSEDRHHCVSDELLYRGPVALEDLLHPLEIAREERADGFRVERLAQLRGSRDVAEENGDRLSLLAPTRR